MSAVIFDTLKVSEALRASFSQEQAARLAEAIAASTQDHAATRGDLQDLKVDWSNGSWGDRFQFHRDRRARPRLVKTFGRWTLFALGLPLLP